MGQTGPQFMVDDSRGFAGPQGERLPEAVVHFTVEPCATFSWRVGADAVLRVLDAGIRVTRIRYPYDHGLPPGSELRLSRGERVWVCADCNAAARLSLNRQLPVRRNVVSRWFARLSSAASNSKSFAGAFRPATGSIHPNQVAVKQDLETGER
ncbi:DUF2917 domain-containing protein [Paraburkholderia sediminicola]|nr:DUF2917 domain-containing protein [Paraburkholderia sediminicola]